MNTTTPAEINTIVQELDATEPKTIASVEPIDNSSNFRIDSSTPELVKAIANIEAFNDYLAKVNIQPISIGGATYGTTTAEHLQETVNAFNQHPRDIAAEAAVEARAACNNHTPEQRVQGVERAMEVINAALPEITPLPEIIVTYPARVVLEVQEELKRIGSDRYNDPEYVKQFIYGLCADWITYR